MTTRADVVLTLADTDLGTVMAAIDASDKTLIRMADGNPPTSVQLGQILSATVEDWDAAKDLWELRVLTLIPDEGDGEDW